MKDLRRLVKEQAHIPPGIHRARLAEPYDGIGQYVKVMLSAGSSSVAYRARVAAGDFGGGRIIPVGSEVTVLSKHGQLEVLLGNLPGMCGDNFSRSSSDTWGIESSVMKLPWYHRGNTPIFTVDGNDGLVDMSISNVPHVNRSSYLLSTFSIPFEITMAFIIEGETDGFEIDWALDISDPPTGGLTIAAYFGPDFAGFSSADSRDYNLDEGEQDDNDVSADGPYLDEEMRARFLVDEYGTYLRVWHAADAEPVTGLVTPPIGGRGESWSRYEVSTVPRDEYAITTFYMNFHTSNAVDDLLYRIHWICYVQGFQCSNGRCSPRIT